MNTSIYILLAAILIMASFIRSDIIEIKQLLENQKDKNNGLPN